jgi:chromosome segregation ATPase
MEVPMPPKVSRTLQVLIEMREEQRHMRKDIAELRHGLTEVRDEVGEVRDGLAQLTTVVTTELGATAAILRDIRTLLRDRLDLRDRVDDHEGRIRKLERRSGT